MYEHDKSIKYFMQFWNFWLYSNQNKFVKKVGKSEVAFV
jgi:hypothetical protein